MPLQHRVTHCDTPAKVLSHTQPRTNSDEGAEFIRNATKQYVQDTKRPQSHVCQLPRGRRNEVKMTLPTRNSRIMGPQFELRLCTRHIAAAPIGTRYGRRSISTRDTMTKTD